MIKEHKVSPKFFQEWNRYKNTDPRLQPYIDNIKALEFDLNNVKTSAARKVLEAELKKCKANYETKKENISLMESVNALLIKEGLISK